MISCFGGSGAINLPNTANVLLPVVRIYINLCGRGFSMQVTYSEIRNIAILVGLTTAVLTVNSTDVIADCIPENILSNANPYAVVFLSFSVTAPVVASSQLSAQESQTSGCTARSTAYEIDKLEFVAYNYDNIAHNIAVGGGDYLASLAWLFNCPQIPLANLLQSRFEHLFPPIRQDAAT